MLGKVATVTAVHPPARFGTLEFDGNEISSFREKDPQNVGWINGGFFVFRKNISSYIENYDDTVLEQDPMELLVSNKQLAGFKHEGFWQPMDTLRDKRNLESIWESGLAPWKA